MIAIVDSGSTKASWAFVDAAGNQHLRKTVGFNPYYQSAEDISAIVISELQPTLPDDVVSHLYFYGAGCSQFAQKEIVKHALETVFKNSAVHVDHDMMAAARALFHNEDGIACIAGTGANTCLFKNGSIVENVYSPGLALGDEGSGGYLGKLLVRDYVRKAMPAHLLKSFEAFTPDRTADMMDKVYKKPFPNRYLASFAPFVAAHQQEPYMHALVYKSFEEMFDQCICRYELYQQYPIRFIGSIAANFHSILTEVASAKGAHIDKIMTSPMDGLIKYHAMSRS